MFLINSCLDLVIATLRNKALLLPKLRSHFAEFLRESYLAPLSILYLPTCVGYGTGIFCLWHCELFLEVWHRLLQCRSISYSRLNSKRFLRFSSSRTFKPVKPISGQFSLLRPSISTKNGTGILTRYPSTTLFSLALGPDLPSADEPSGGNLGFSGYRILTYIFVTQADILTSASSISASANTSTYNRTLPYRYIQYIAQFRQIT